MYFQDIILRLHEFWAKEGSILLQPYHIEKEGEFQGLDEFSKILTLENLSEMDDDSFIQTVYPKLWYIEKDQLWLWRCNILRAMANSKNKDYLQYIQPALKHSNENIREMAAWAYEKLDSIRK